MLLSESAENNGVNVQEMYDEIYNDELGIKFKRHGLMPKTQFVPYNMKITGYEEGLFKMPDGNYSKYLLHAMYTGDSKEVYTNRPFTIWADNPGENLLSRIKKL